MSFQVTLDKTDTVSQRYDKITDASYPQIGYEKFVRAEVERWFQVNGISGFEINDISFIHMCIVEIRAQYPLLFQKLAKEDYSYEHKVEQKIK